MIVESYEKGIFNLGDASKDKVRSAKLNEAICCNERCAFFNQCSIYWVDDSMFIDDVKLAKNLLALAVLPRESISYDRETRSMPSAMRAGMPSSRSR